MASQYWTEGPKTKRKASSDLIFDSVEVGRNFCYAPLKIIFFMSSAITNSNNKID